MANKDENYSSDDLLSAVESSLQRSGAYRKIKGQIRAHVYHALEDKTVSLPDKPPDVFLAAELVKDFLTRFNLGNTCSVFCEEMGQPEEMAVDRELLGEELGVSTVGSDDNMPLLLLLIQHMKNQKIEFLRQVQSSMTVEPPGEEEDCLSQGGHQHGAHAEDQSQPTNYDS
eukprot:gene3546-3883_t